MAEQVGVGRACEKLGQVKAELIGLWEGDRWGVGHSEVEGKSIN